jgi:hypothetical protein
VFPARSWYYAFPPMTVVPVGGRHPMNTFTCLCLIDLVCVLTIQSTRVVSHFHSRSCRSRFHEQCVYVCVCVCVCERERRMVVAYKQNIKNKLIGTLCGDCGVSRGSSPRNEERKSRSSGQAFDGVGSAL